MDEEIAKLDAEVETLREENKKLEAGNGDAIRSTESLLISVEVKEVYSTKSTSELEAYDRELDQEVRPDLVIEERKF